MFTGIIEEIGTISALNPMDGGFRVKIACQIITDDLKIDDSVSVNGICLTVVENSVKQFTVEAVGATLSKTVMKNYSRGDKVNLERALKLSDRLGGHFVYGHVNGIGKIEQIKKLGKNYYVEISLPEELKKYLIDEGSIAVDGISLTVASVSGNRFGISVIPHTWKNTNLHVRKAGDEVNIETDFLAKHIERLLSLKNKSKITEEWLKEIGY